MYVLLCSCYAMLYHINLYRGNSYKDNLFLHLTCAVDLGSRVLISLGGIITPN